MPYSISRAVGARRIISLWFAFLALQPLAYGQGTIAQGSLSGVVSDTTEAVVPGASVTIKANDATTLRNTTSANDGSFAFRNLPSGTYSIGVTARGFAAYRNLSAAVATGRDTHLDVHLLPPGSEAQVTVQAVTDAIDTTQSSPATNIDRDRIEELPIPQRNYLNFTLLAPSLGEANPAATIQEPTAGENGFTAGGLRPTSNAVNIDGVDDNDEFTGMSRTELSPEAISDFQVVNHGYAAQAGGSAGGAVDVETRSGTATQHGDAFLFVQNGALNATPALERPPHKPDESRLRAGLSTGGEWKRAGLFYYAAAEQEIARGEEATDFDPQTVEEIDSALTEPGPLRGMRLQQGFFPTTNQETEFSTRTDRAISKSSLMLRYALTNSRAINDAFHTDDLADATARGSAFTNDNSINGSWSTTFSQRSMNQISFEAAQRHVLLRTGSQTGPGAVVAGAAEFGTPYSGNSERNETHFDLGDQLMRQFGNHLFQAGISESAIVLRSTSRDGFSGIYVFPSLDALTHAQPDFYLQSFGDPHTSFQELRSAAYVQDHWTLRPGVTIDYGLRYEYNHLPSPLPQDAINFDPRFGVAWSPRKQWVFRGGFGIFTDRYLLSTINRTQQFDGRHAFQQVLEENDAAALYRSGNPLPSPQSGVAPSVWMANKRLQNPYAETASFGVEHALHAQWTVGGEYRFVRGLHMGRTVNTNLAPPDILTLANASSLGVASPTPQQLGRPIFSTQRLNTAYDATNDFETDTSSTYQGLTVNINRQFTEDFELLAGYTFSRATDTASFDTEQPQNPYADQNERDPSLNDLTHRFVLSGLWALGPDLDDAQDKTKASRPTALQQMFYGLEFAPIITAHNGFRDNPLTGVDSNREHIYPFAARPQGFSRNSLNTPATVNFDLRVLKMIPVSRGHLDIVAESFNVLNHQNIQRINVAYGSDAAASPSFKQPIQASDSRRIQFSLDFEY